MSETLKQNIDNTKHVSNQIAELQQGKRGTYSISIAKVISIDQTKREANVFLFDDNKIVTAIVLQDVNSWNIIGNINAGDLVIVMHIRTLSPLILMRVADDRMFSRRANEDSINNGGVTHAMAGGGAAGLAG